jgi:hypothetical protein
MGKMFDAPRAVFGEQILRPETQDMAVFVDGVENIVEAQQNVAVCYLEDGSVEDACPPLKALLHIMANGHYEGKDVHDPAIRALFTREALLASDWYQERLTTKQVRDIRLWERHIAYLDTFAHRTSHQDLAERLDIQERIEGAKTKLEWVKSTAYLQSLSGTIGADPLRPAQSIV